MNILLIVLAALAAIAGSLAYLSYIYRAPDMSRFDQPQAPLIIDAGEVSSQHEEVLKKLAAYHADPTDIRDIPARRKMFDERFTVDVDAEIRPVDANGIPGEWILAEGADPGKRLLYLHGGAFIVGSPRSHRFITAELSRRAGASVLAIDYRKQPEHKTINCHEDARIAYQWILKNGPSGPGDTASLFVAGDSAGGNLTLGVIAWARDQGLPTANGAIALAPLTDATMSSPTWKENLETDPFLGPSIGQLLKAPGLVRKIVGRIQSGKPINHPELSPLLGRLDNLPPTLIQVSKHEMLYGDSQRYANKATHEGSQVILQVWPKLVHVFQIFSFLPETDNALNRIADFIASRVEGAEAVGNG